MAGRGGIFSNNRKMSRPKGKAEYEWKHQKWLELDNKKLSEQQWGLGHID